MSGAGTLVVAHRTCPVDAPENSIAGIAHAAAVGARGISAHWSVITHEFVARAHTRGLRVFSWCEERGGHHEKLDVALDGIVTEWPASVRASLRPVAAS